MLLLTLLLHILFHTGETGLIFTIFHLKYISFVLLHCVIKLHKTSLSFNKFYKTTKAEFYLGEKIDLFSLFVILEMTKPEYIKYSYMH